MHVKLEKKIMYHCLLSRDESFAQQTRVALRQPLSNVVK